MRTDPPLAGLAEDLFAYLARRFPVCCASDEFVYFPQAVSEDVQWSSWDDFSRGSVDEAVATLRGFRADLLGAVRKDRRGPGEGSGLAVALQRAARTLEEQFTELRTHAVQPTFALTAATVGLIQAVQSGEADALALRLDTLPLFLDRSFSSLEGVPSIYRDLGVRMAEGLGIWMGSFPAGEPLRGALRAVSAQRDRLKALPVVEQFRLPADLFERVVTEHTGSGLSLKDALGELEEEAAVADRRLAHEATVLGHGRDWEGAYHSAGGDPVPPGGKRALLAREIGRLRDHCASHGFGRLSRAEGNALAIEPLPGSLTAVRAADSYNAKPGHPFPGGVFYVFDQSGLGEAGTALHPVYRMTAAHEAYPGHHLLDSHRWNNPLPALRPLEYPLFYEGWACFGEDLMLETGAFTRPFDRLILFRRRYRHAVRGRVDLLLHSGALDLEEGASRLCAAGFPEERARETIRKYALRPAYQMCYTVGRRRFQSLFDQYGKGDPAPFVNTVLEGGELGFEDLEANLKRKTGDRDKL